MSTRHAIALSTLLAAASLTNAAIIGVTGQAIQIGAPASCFPFALTGPNAFVWNEQTNVTVSAQPVDMSVNPSSAPSGPTPAVLAGTYDSHFIHFETASGNAATGTVTFSSPIVGVMYNDTFLDLSDAPFGAGGTLYPTGFVGRGFNLSGTITILGPVLRFDFHGIPGQIGPEQVRVLTHSVPTPGSLALLGTGGLLALRRRRR